MGDGHEVMFIKGNYLQHIHFMLAPQLILAFFGL